MKRECRRGKRVCEERMVLVWEGVLCNRRGLVTLDKPELDLECLPPCTYYTVSMLNMPISNSHICLCLILFGLVLSYQTLGAVCCRQHNVRTGEGTNGDVWGQF